MNTAILVDGGFYRKRAAFLWGRKTPQRRAMELMAYCQDHLKYVRKHMPNTNLYRIFWEGIDFILDPMWAEIKDSLFEHIDGLHSNWAKN